MSRDFLRLTEQEKKSIAQRLLSNCIAEIKRGVIRAGSGKTVIQAAIDWAEENYKSGADTLIGKAVINKRSIKNSLSHGITRAKIDAIPAIKDVLEKGEYLGGSDDFAGATIKNHFFAGRVRFSDSDKIVFCRVRKAEGDKTNRFYVHEVLTEDDLKNKGAFLQTAAAHPNDGKLHGGMPLYAAILQEILESVNEK